jgi:glycosyltransferase involved in cell wall biosynthesis
LKILYHHRVASKDGQDVHITGMIEAFRRLGHEVVISAPPMAAVSNLGFDGGFVARLRRILPPVLSEMLELGYSGLAFVRLWRAWRTERPDLLYERYNLYSLSGAWLRRLTGIPHLLEINAPLADERAAHGGLALRGLALRCERAVWRTADVVLPVSAVLARRVAAAGVEPSRIMVVHNGIDRQAIARVRAQEGLRRRIGAEDRVLLGFAGFVRDWHGLPEAVEAIADLGGQTALHLLVIGDGPGLEAVKDRARSRGVADRVTCLGLIQRDEVGALLAACDIALQPRVVDYASPLKLFEYMALGLAIIAPDQPNIREVLTDGVDALLIDASRPETLRDAIARLAADEGLRRRLGAAASAAIAERGYSWDDNARRVIERADLP